jgi:hypothetical protein
MIGRFFMAMILPSSGGTKAVQPCKKKSGRKYEQLLLNGR